MTAETLEKLQIINDEMRARRAAITTCDDYLAANINLSAFISTPAGKKMINTNSEGWLLAKHREQEALLKLSTTQQQLRSQINKFHAQEDLQAATSSSYKA